ncbi:MAG: carboxypeptidase regulatory-like domain-containing protein [Mycobacterium leprae]
MRKLLALMVALLLLSLQAPAFAGPAPLSPLPERSLLVSVITEQGLPLEGAAVQLLLPGRPDSHVLRTNKAGQAFFSLTDSFSFWVRAWAEGYAIAERSYIPAGDGPELTLNLVPYRTVLTGLVTNEQGLPVARARVTAWLDGLGLQGETRSDDQGVYLLEGLQARDGYMLQVEAVDFQPFVQTGVTLATGVRNQTDLALTPATATVTGEVINSRTKAPAADVKAELILNGWGTVAETKTDTYGYFQFTAGPWNQDGYQVRLSAPGFETYTSGLFALDAGAWNDFSGTNRIALNPLHAQFEGSVLDQNGTPLPNTPVELQRSDLGTVATGSTDEKGFFTFQQLPAGTYRVRALPLGDREQGATAWLALVGGDRASADVSANDPDKTSYGSSAIVGTVLDYLDNPVKDALVVAERGTDRAEARTDAQGRYRLSVQANIEDGVDPDTSSGYHVTVAKEGFIPTDIQQTADDAAPPAFVDVRFKATNRADFTLQPAQSELAGRVLDDHGRPVRGTPVALVQEGAGEVARVVTDAAGHYRFTALPVARQARYVPVVISDRYFPSSIAPGGNLVAPLSLNPGTASTQILTVRPRLTEIQGIVRAGSDKPASLATVTVVDPARKMEWTGTTATNGSYHIAVPAWPGRQYLVRAAAERAAQGSLTAAVNPADNQAVVANLSVVPTATITGILYGPDGKPVPNATIALWSESKAEPVDSVQTDSAGIYRFAHLTPGHRYQVAYPSGNNTLNSLAPGEPVLTPLSLPAAGETLWADLSTVVPSEAPSGMQEVTP